MNDSEASEATLEIRSALDGATLVFCIAGVGPEGTTIHVAYTSANFRGAVAVSTYFVGPPTAFFSEIARDWRGWKGNKSWADLDRALTLDATSDSTGHVMLRVEIHSIFENTSMTGSLMLEAGSLERLARDVAELFRNDRSSAGPDAV